MKSVLVGGEVELCIGYGAELVDCDVEIMPESEDSMVTGPAVLKPGAPSVKEIDFDVG